MSMRCWRGVVSSLNEVRSRRPEQFRRMYSMLLHGCRLNEVRPRRPEQSAHLAHNAVVVVNVSMKSGLEGRNNLI